MKTVFLFSGQGSQFYQMGIELMQGLPFFKQKMEALDSIVSSISGHSVLDEIYGSLKKKSQPFSKLTHTYPAVFMLEHALACTLIELEGIKPDYLIGASMGEFAAAVAAGIMTEETALYTLITHGIEVERVLPKGNGGMLAILDNVDLYYQNPMIRGNAELAAINSPKHFTLAGNKKKLDNIKKGLRQRKIFFLDIPVDYAFHSTELDPLEAFSLDLISKIELKKPKIPFVSCLKGQQISELNKRYFWEVVRKPIQFTKAILSLEEKEGQSPMTYIDLGPSGTLATFTKQIFEARNQQINHIFPIVNMFAAGVENLNTLKRHYAQMTKTKTMTINNQLAYLFPGQGSQKVGMGAALFDEFEKEVAMADVILGYSIKELCLESDTKKLGQTQFTQPALYVVDCLEYLKSIKEKGQKPGFVAGHSLGEYAALFAASAFDFETGLHLVKKRGGLMAKIENGGMAAILGLSIDEVSQFLIDYKLEKIDIANINSPSQIVISGLRDQLEMAKVLFNKSEIGKKKGFIPLNTSGAFHSRYMQEAQEEFTNYLHNFQYNEPQIPVIANAEAVLYQKKEIVNLLSRQLVQPVRWVETIQLLKAMGVEKFEEKGPGIVLTKLTDATLKEPIPLEVAEKAKAITSNKQEYKTSPTKLPKNSSNGIYKVEEKSTKQATYLGSPDYKKKYQSKYAYMVAGLQGGNMSTKMLHDLRSNNILGFIGTSIIPPEDITSIVASAKESDLNMPFGLTLMFDQLVSVKEEKVFQIAHKYKIPYIEAVGYLQPSKELIRYKLSGISLSHEGEIAAANKIFARVSLPEMAQLFLSPAPQKTIDLLLKEGSITEEQARLANRIPIADELIVENNSGWNNMEYSTEVLLPLMVKLAKQLYQELDLAYEVGIGVAGDIGTPYAAAAAFLLGTDFIATGVINACTKNANLSAAAKDLLQKATVQDIEYAPAINQFEIGGKVKVLRKGGFFPARINKLYELYRKHQSLDDLEDKTKDKLENRYFGKSLQDAWEEARSTILFNDPQLLQKVNANPKYKMAVVFRWYAWRGWNAAINGQEQHKVNYQIFCTPAMAAFNLWVKETPMEDWNNRDAVAIADKLMSDTAQLINQRVKELQLTLSS